MAPTSPDRYARSYFRSILSTRDRLREDRDATCYAFEITGTNKVEAVTSRDGGSMVLLDIYLVDFSVLLGFRGIVFFDCFPSVSVLLFLAARIRLGTRVGLHLLLWSVMIMVACL